MKRYYRYFGGFIKSQEAWLNTMSAKGYRLVRAEKMLYEFEEISPNAYQYCVEFVGEKSQKDLQDYVSFLEEMEYVIFYKNLNLNYSIGKVKYRPWAEKGGRIATTGTTFNKELLIVEKKNDGKPLELHMQYDDIIIYLSKIRRMWLYLFVFLGVLSVAMSSVIAGIFALICLLPTFFYGITIRRYRKEKLINE